MSCWPLPGRWDQYPVSLAKILERVPAYSADRVRVAMALSADEVVVSTSAALRQFHFLSNLGLTRITRNNEVARTPLGNEYLLNRSPEIVQAQLRRRVYAVKEIETILRGGSKPISEILEILKDTHGVPWESVWQVRFRLNWMRGFGIAERLSEAESVGRYSEWRLLPRDKRSRGRTSGSP
jgi:hypothetical protein